MGEKNVSLCFVLMLAPKAQQTRPSTAVGGHSSGVPSTVKTIVLLHERYGTMPLADLFSHAVSLARNGWILDEYGASRLAAFVDSISMFNATAELYLRPDGSPRQAGDTMLNPDLANTLELIAQDKGESFYHGDIADEIIKTITETSINPGVLTKEDLVNYEPVFREPIHYTYKGYDLYTMNLPSSGATVGMAMKVLEQYNLKELGYYSADSLTLLLNALTVAYGILKQPY